MSETLPATHRCDTGDFDRTVCPEPCSTMHSYCTICGQRQDPCTSDPCQITRVGDACKFARIDVG